MMGLQIPPPRVAMPFMPGLWDWQAVDEGPGPFEGGNHSHASILEFVRYIAGAGDTSDVAPTAGGTLTINCQALGSYDYAIKLGNQTISSFSNADWFTTTADSRAAIVIVKGDLTVNAGQTLIPSHRKLFTAVHVTGTLTVNGAISMSARGANHSGTGSYISANAIRIATGTFSSVSNPQVPAAGANGGGAITQSASGGTNGTTGTAGNDGACGGGGAGGAARTSNGSAVSGAGAAGTAFGGGSGGGGAIRQSSGTSTAGSGAASGGAGGNGAGASSWAWGAGGAAGNAGGSGASGGAGSASGGGDGTGGVLLALVEGSYAGSGSVTAAGANGGNASATGPSGLASGGGGSGGGSVTVMFGGSDSGPTPTAAGGSGGSGSGSTQSANGGNGGSGTARKLAL